MSNEGGSGAGKIAFIVIIVAILLPILLILIFFAILFFFFQNGSFCSDLMGWRIELGKCEAAQYKYDVILEEEVPNIGEAMAKLREGMASEAFLGEDGELSNPTDMKPISFTYKQGEDAEGNPKEVTFEEYPGAVYIRSLMTLDDYSLEGIELTDEAVEERFGFSVEQLLTESTIGLKGGNNDEVLNEGFDNDKELIKKISNKVIEVGDTYDFYPSILMAQILLESDSGNSELATKANNMLGIKSDGNWKGEVYTKASKEGNGEMVTSDFKKYGSIEESIEDYGKRTTEGQWMIDRYAPTKRSQNDTYNASLRKIAELYATDPQYEEKVLAIIERYQLTELDNKEFSEVNVPSIAEDNVLPSIVPVEKEEKEEKKKKETIQSLNVPVETTDTVEKPVITNPLKGKTIVLDPGHGGNDGGATPYASYPEKVFNLEIGLAMKSKLEALGATVIMTRSGDTYPQNPDRPKVAINNSADMFISIHANSSETESAQGTETLFGSVKDKALAVEVQKHLISAWGLKDRGVKQRSDLAVLRGLLSTDIPAILIEPGFMQNKAVFDSHFMNQEMKNRLTIGVIAGVMSHYGLELTHEMKDILGEIPPSVQGENDGIGGPSDSHLTTMGRKHNNFLTVWMMARTMQEEYEKGDDSDIEHVFDDIIEEREVSLDFNRRDWMMTIQTESYMCYLVGDKTGIFRSLMDNLGFKELERIPCENLDDVYEKTFGESITFIPAQYQSIVGQTSKEERTVYTCADDSMATTNPETNLPWCGEGVEMTTKTTNKKMLTYPEPGDMLGQFGLFTIYLNDITVPKNDDSYTEYLEKRILRDTYGLEYEIGAISMMTAENACVNSDITPGSGQVSEAVRSYAEPIKKELSKYGLEGMMPILLGIMQQESGGTLSLDVMQSSESKGWEANTITDPQESIEAGVEHFYKVYTRGQSKGVDLQSVIQSYNMGGGYIDHVAKNGGKHTEELAKQFSSLQMAKAPGKYTCAVDNFRYPHCYGDFSYTGKVLSYVSTEDAELISNTAGTNENPCIPSMATEFAGDGSVLGEESFQKLFAAAEKYKGTKYRYGGNDPYKGIDCSAFMQVIYKEALGKSLPRTAATQHDATKRINKEELTPGDLIFFQTNGRKVGHVGMYIGNGKMYHSGSTYGVSTVDVFKGYWAPLIVGYGRI